MKLFITFLAASSALTPTHPPIYATRVGSCYTCDAATWEECEREGDYQTCMDNEEVCQIEVRQRMPEGPPIKIKMGCKWEQACKDNKIQNFGGPDNDRAVKDYQCQPHPWNREPSVCRQCCNDSEDCAFDFLELNDGDLGYGPQNYRDWMRPMVNYVG